MEKGSLFSLDRLNLNYLWDIRGGNIWSDVLIAGLNCRRESRPSIFIYEWL